jgi:hypothetical protein
VQTVVETSPYLVAAKRNRLTRDEMSAIVDAVARQPDTGDLIERSGGFRKVRFGRPGRGKSGGLRVITYWPSPRMPVFLMTVYGKNRKDDLSSAELGMLRRLGQAINDHYGSSDDEESI